MTLAGIKPGDLVRCDIRGDRFLAEVIEPPAGAKLAGSTKGVIWVGPVGNGRTIRTVKARQVVDHWRHRKSRTGRDA